MNRPDITIRPLPGKWVVRAAGAILAETRAALELREGTLPPVVYFPRQDVGMAFMDRSDKVTTCPWKGEASYFHLAAKSGRIENAAWSYETPIEDVAAIAGFLAFDPARATVEQI